MLIEEQKLKAVFEELAKSSINERSERSYLEEISRNIISSLKQFDQPSIVDSLFPLGSVRQFEPLDVEIISDYPFWWVRYKNLSGKYLDLEKFDDKDSVVNFCNEKGLRVKND